MIVTCPSCSTRYLVDPRALGATGRKVRCANCAHVWQQSPPQPEEHRPALDLPPVIFPPQAPPERSPEQQERDRRQLPALPKQRRIPWMAIGWAALILLVLGGVTGAVVARDQVAGWWPPAGRLYAMVGLPVAPPGAGLEFRKVIPTRETENGLPTMVIKGEVANVSTAPREVPKLKVILRDASDRELQSWVFSITDERLQPGASVPFRTSIAQPSEAAVGILVMFAVNGM